ncbi:carboxyl transferase domain-containing protein [Halioxenophilus sp. WMMB6]|uniref:carboxyl transferase domain-containing protein n=1 Tax=Halioxenophilus sp. WMMB6 TaxID=3073815 RepID=UPI00295E2495|nr:carboxyl transferase domain-containing protein [Halioxenophilus sp. WMMB6]
MPEQPVNANAPATAINSTIKKLLIANRGEVAVRIARTARDLGITTVALYSQEDANSGHLRLADEPQPLPGRGPAAYLDGEQIITLAQHLGCDAIHPGYGFLSENSQFALACQAAGIRFVGPSPAQLALFGDKTQALALAQQCGVPVNPATAGAVTLAEAKAFLSAQPPGQAVMIKAVAGGGGKGMRVVSSQEALDSAWPRCQREAERAFGNGSLYLERYLTNARHIEVQVVGDGRQVSHLWERECTLQRQQQKLVEFAPSPSLTNEQRQLLFSYATRLAEACHYQSLGTFEFLFDLNRANEESAFLFMEANPRLQVEHTVTEEILGLDLVAVQLALAAGQSLADLRLAPGEAPSPRGLSMQLRVNMETLDDCGRPLPTSGTLVAFNPPGGPGVRVDTFAYPGYTTNTQFDSLLAKLIVSSASPSYPALLNRALRAAAEFTIEGVATNLPFLAQLLAHPAVTANQVHTRFIAEHMAELLPAKAPQEHNQSDDGTETITAPLAGLLSQFSVAVGDSVQAGSELALVEAMKLEHELRAPVSGVVLALLAPAGSQVGQGQPLLRLAPSDSDQQHPTNHKSFDPDAIRNDLQELRERVACTLDEQRPAAVERRRNRGQRTARENIAQLCDADSFIEYGQLAVAYLHARKSDEELRQTTPADGFITGIGTVNGELFGEAASQVAVGAYDATVMAGTQGHKNHQKADRLFDLAREQKLPLVLFAEGGGGRPREDPVTIAALENTNFQKLAQLSGQVPVVGVVSGRCFAGNAALLGLADVIIATDNSNIGMAGPALIEAGGLGSFTPEQVGPIEVQHANGVVDIRVPDEPAAVEACQRYLGYFQGPLPHWQAHDERLLRHVVPEQRLRVYDVRRVIELIADCDSVLELRSAFGQAYVTALIRVEGRPLGVIANNPSFNAGAIDSPAADKAARFLRLCDAHGLPVLSLIDTPGIMVGPEAEATALVRHSARLFATAASLTVPLFAVVLRKAYGLGAAAAAGGNFKVPTFTIAWPSGELGGMGLEGGVRLAYKKELEAISDPAERQAFFEQRVESRYRKGKAVNIASYFELDAVIDPAETRRWLKRGLEACAKSLVKGGGRFIDTW